MNVLVAVGGYPHSRSTVAFAKMLASPSKTDLTVLNVIENEQDRPRSEDTLASAHQQLDGLPVKTQTRIGVPTDQILEAAREQSCDLLVIGAHDRPRLTEVLLGSVARKLVAHAPCSVVVVKGERPQLGRILICTGGKHYADPTVTEGIELARAAGAEVTVLYVAMQTATMYAGLQELEQPLSELLQTDTDEAHHLRRAAEAMEAVEVKGSIQLRHGPIVEEILREGSLGDYDLIVLGARFKRGAIRDLFLTNVTGNVLDRASRPVLVAMGSSIGRW